MKRRIIELRFRDEKMDCRTEVLDEKMDSRTEAQDKKMDCRTEVLHKKMECPIHGLLKGWIVQVMTH
jgi:hypothetical protein